VLTVGYVPDLDPALIAEHPEVCPAVLDSCLAWLAENAAHLPGPEQILAGREAGIRSGLYACEFPVELGGGSVPQRIAVRLHEEAAAAGQQYGRWLLSAPIGPCRILLAGTPEQQERWMRPLIEGRMTRCLAMTEERCGSDLAEVSTTAVRSGGRWVLTGRKFLISNAAQADLAIVFARAAGDAGSGTTYFAFETSVPGWNIVRRLPGMDPYADQYEVELNGIELDDDAVLGGLERVGGAAGLASEWLPYGRISLAARAVGMSRYALDVARRHAASRRLGGERLDAKQHIRELIVRSDVKLEAARCLVRRAAETIDDGQLAVREAAMAKLYASTAACEIVDDAMQVLGGRGWLTEYRLEQIYREARLLRIVDGTTELLKETVFHLPPSYPGRGREHDGRSGPGS
jgi:alkylation response protein AidB-like acyl-CoA dehydrogenase